MNASGENEFRAAQRLNTQQQRLLQRNDTETFTRLTPDDRLLPISEGLGVSVVVCGHTHIEFGHKCASDIS